MQGKSQSPFKGIFSSRRSQRAIRADALLGFLKSLRPYGRKGKITKADIGSIYDALGFLKEDKGKLVKTREDFDRFMRIKHAYQCCPGATKFIQAHGAMIPAQIISGMRVGTFKVPQGVYIITLTTLSNSCPFLAALHKEFEIFYNHGHTLFKARRRGLPGDRTRVKTKEGEEFERSLNARIPHPGGFHLKNHLPGDEANDQMLQFYGKGCGGRQGECSIDCFFGPHKRRRWKKNCPMIGYKQPSHLTEQMTLKKLVRKEGPGVYIMFACRVFGENFPEAAVKLARQVSGKR
ncbi:hypothetical protein OAK19_00285 [Aureispira]|nr:hypothetical protein [Aureispira sp.]